MLLRSFVLLLLTTACAPTVNTRPLRNCEAADETVDCCTRSEQCVNYFGASFPICTTPGDETGRCSECTVDEQCDLDSFCDVDAPAGPYCAPLPGRSD
ncbi:MAG: hypothetical protein AB8H79_02905 [Myxococcota bacterium]